MKSKIKKISSHLIKLLITVAVLGWIVKTYGWQKICDSVMTADLKWLITGVIMFVTSIFFGAVQWHVILINKKIEIKFLKALKIFFTGIFFNNFILGMVAGDAFKVAALHINHNKGKSGFAATLLERLMGLVILSVYAIVGGAIILISNIQQEKDMYMVLGVLALFISILFGFFMLLLSQRLQKFARFILNKLPDFMSKELIRDLLEEAFLNRHGKEDMVMLAKVGMISFVIQTLRIGVNITAALALGLFSFSVLHYFFVIIPVIALMMIVPMPFGVRETVGGVLFGMAGFSVDQSVIMLFLATIVSITASLAGGVFFLTDKSEKSALKEVIEEEEAGHFG